MGDDRYDKVKHDGKTVDKYTDYNLHLAEERLGYELSIVQGSYNKGVAASAGTHDGGGCVDLKPWDWQNKVRVLRELGFAAWYRPYRKGVWPAHIHAVLIGNAKLAPLAKQQVQAYKNGRDGLAGNGRDTFWRPAVIKNAAYKEPTVSKVVDPIQWALWKITLPIGKNGKPTEDYPADTAYRPWYGRDTSDRNWLLFRAPVDGVTTSGSGYPRSELREMNANGTKAAWSSRKGWHNLSGAAEIRKLPGRKPSVVIAQIHDADDDVVMIRLDGTTLYLYESLGKGKGATKHKLFSGYRLGATLTYSISAAAGGIRVVVNGNKVDIPGRLIDGGYFKAGCYSQANESNGTGYAEVAHKGVRVRHI